MRIMRMRIMRTGCSTAGSFGRPVRRVRVDHFACPRVCTRWPTAGGHDKPPAAGRNFRFSEPRTISAGFGSF